MRDLKQTFANGFTVMVLGSALLFIFGADVLNGLVDLARSLGAN